ncbi:MAG: efflux RND transporter periplasmic adaptor subunit [Candidatus Eremiobacteraeota bacterium]|nr:efflux RND transporter periplasmic adaptor subunit [Candidatus Eremiobacteraeota bacterium]
MRSGREVLFPALLIPFLIFSLAGCPGREKAEQPAPPVKPVKVIAVREGILEKVLSFTGTIEPVEKAEIYSKIPGKVEQVSCREGDRVEAGEILIRLEDADLRATVAQAEAGLRMAQARLSQARAGISLQATKTRTDINNANHALNQAEANYDLAKTDLGRTNDLYNDSAIAHQQLDVAENREKVSRKALESARENVKLAEASVARDRIHEEDVRVALAGVSQAEAALRIARTQLSYARITSPITGIVTSRGVEPGELVTGSTMSRMAPLLKIIDNREVLVDTKIPQKDISIFQTGRMVGVAVDGIKGREYRGKVTAILPAADQLDRSFRIKISIPNPGTMLKSGMFARVHVTTYRKAHALLVPRESLQERGQKKVLFIVSQDKAEMREVKPGANDEARLEILSGLREGEKVVTAGQTILNDGDMVRVEKGEGS